MICKIMQGRNARRGIVGAVVIVCMMMLNTAHAQPKMTQVSFGQSSSQILNRIGFDQKLNAQLPLETPFYDEDKREVPLGTYFKSKRPVVLALVYYECPMLCTQVLN